MRQSPAELCALRDRANSLGYAAVDAICNYYETLQSRPVKAEVMPGYLIDSLPRAYGLAWGAECSRLMDRRGSYHGGRLQPYRAGLSGEDSAR